MKSLTAFLDKFKTLTPPERFVKDACINAVQKVTGIILAAHEIDIRGETLFIITSPAKKTDIILHKPAVLAELNAALTPYRKTVSEIK